MDDEERRRGQLEKLAELERQAQDLVDRPHYHMHDGAPVLDPASGEPLRDDGPVLRGLDVQLGVLKLRARILGYEAPQRHHLVDEQGNTLDVTRLIAALRRAGIVPADDEDA